MVEYTPAPVCPKCDWKAVALAYEAAKNNQPERIKVTCSRCLFEWYMRPKVGGSV